jgi:hypothetical protein
MLIEDTGTVTTPLYIYICMYVCMYIKFAPPALSLNVDSLFKYFRIYVWFRVLYILIVLLLI